MAELPHRYFRVKSEVYPSITAHVDTTRGYPDETTQRGLQPFQELPKDADGWGLIAIDNWRFQEEDNALINTVLDEGAADELTREEYENLRYPPEPDPEPEP
jgi:hypothetical protein